MIKTISVDPISPDLMNEIGMSWHTEPDGSAYIVNELVPVSDTEAKEYYEAANTLYDMFIEAGQYVIDNNLFTELDIPFNLVDQIKRSWDEDHWHLYGRFDFAGGIDGQPIKLIEFNADTPTSLFETSIIQWASLRANNMDEECQFNTIYGHIQDNYRRLIVGEDLEAFDDEYDYQSILFSSVRDMPEDEQTVRLLQRMAEDAGFDTDFAYMDEVGFLEKEGIFNSDQTRFDFWFKLYPWEDISIDGSGICSILDEISHNQQAIVLNPAYTLLFQSKGIMKVLCDLFPNSPYLLETKYEPLQNKKQVAKRLFGREGANTRIIEASGVESLDVGGPYDHYKEIYQEFVDFPKDRQGNNYQAGVFFAYEGCGLGFRRGGDVIDDLSQFVGHVIT